MKAALYARVSDASQAEADRQSLPFQREAFEARCVERGYERGEAYVDVESGTKASRVNYQRMLEDAKARQFDVLVVTFLDRFGRDQWEVMGAIRDLRQWGVEIDSLNDDMSEFVMVALTAWKADQESKRIGQRVKDTSHRAVRSGKPMGSFPYGYKRFRNEDGWGIAIDEPQAAVVREIFRLYLEDAQSMEQIKRLLNKQLIPSARGMRWSSEAVYNVIARRTYYGVWTYGETVVENVAPAIISKETWERANEIRARKRAMVAPRSHRSDYLLSGIMYCAHCGGKMYGNTSLPKGGRFGSYARYSCSRYFKTGGCDVRNQHDKDKLEQVVIDQLRAHFDFSSPIEVQREDSRARLRAELAATERTLASIPTRLLRNLSMLDNGTINEETLKLYNRTIELEQQTAQAARARVTAAIASETDEATRQERHERLSQAFAEDFAGMNPQQQKAMIREVVGRIEVTNGSYNPLITLVAPTSVSQSHR